LAEKHVDGDATGGDEHVTQSDPCRPDPSGVTRSASFLSAILGFAFIGIFITVWMQQVLISRVSGGLPVKELSSFWKVWAAAVSANYLFLIIGLVLCLLATHLMDGSAWNVIRVVAVAIAAMAAAIMTMGLVTVLVNLNTSLPLSDFNTVTILLRILIEIAALVAIVILEMRGLSKRKKAGVEARL
jgi:hypothetical protein